MKADSISPGEKEPRVKAISTYKKTICRISKFYAACTRSFVWIPANWTLKKWKPAIRAAVAAWICAILFVIPSVEKILGQASFLILIASFLSAPSDSFPATLEREINILLLVGIAWAWGSLGIFLADLTRSVHDASVTLGDAITGRYIEAAPTAIMAVFLFFGSFFFLFIKANQGPGPFLFGSIFGCICLDILVTTSILFPFPYYAVGQAIMIPLVFHSAVAIGVAAILFPSSASDDFLVKLSNIYPPLQQSLIAHQTLLDSAPESRDYSPEEILTNVDKAEAGLTPLAAATRLLPVDLVWRRFGPTDFDKIHDITRKLVLRANGMVAYFTLVEPMREKFPVTPLDSRFHTPITSVNTTPAQTRPPSPDHEPRTGGHTPVSPTARRRHRRSRKPGGSHDHHHHLHSSLLHLAIQRNAASQEHAVGVFESQRYIDIEAIHLSDPDSEELTAEFTRLLAQSSQPVLKQCELVARNVYEWLDHATKHNFHSLSFFEGRKRAKERQERLDNLHSLHEEFKKVTESWKSSTRYNVLDPYRFAFEPEAQRPFNRKLPPHKYLFHCFVYQFHLMRFAVLLLDALTELIRLEKERTKSRLWTPVSTIKDFLASMSDDVEDYTEEDPDYVKGMQIDPSDLGEASRRNPDYLPPSNAFEIAVSFIYDAFAGMKGGNVTFGIKAGVLSVLLALPAFFPSTAQFSYENKVIWGIFMAQITSARFRGDTAFGFFARVISTIGGGIIGVIIWYISAGAGNGNAYGLAATFLVCFPAMFYFNLYWPIPVIIKLIFFVTSMLVVGYSYQDSRLAQPSSPGIGFAVAWHRFVLVVSGVTAAFLFSFLPPSKTIRSYQRATLSTTSCQIGSIYCCIITFANCRHQEARDSASLNRSLLAIRGKLKRSIIAATNVGYEFSLRGKWPKERYEDITKIQMQLCFLLSHLMSVVEQLDPVWSKAFLRRTRLLEADFIGDILAVISMISNSLRTGNPLPQITPCPLVDRFMRQNKGLEVEIVEAEYSPRRSKAMTIDILEDLQYLMLCVGVSTVFGIITRLDRLMVATKALVGEHYHVGGVGLDNLSLRRISQQTTSRTGMI